MNPRSNGRHGDAWVVALVVALVGFAATQPRAERNPAPVRATAPSSACLSHAADLSHCAPAQR